MSAAFGSRSHGTGVRVHGKAEIRAVLVKRDPVLSVKSINVVAKLAAVFAGVIADRTLQDRKRIPTTKSGLRRLS